MCLFVCVYVVRVRVCVPPRLLITSGMMWCDIDPIQLVNKFRGFIWQLLLVGMVLAFICVMETSPIRVS